MGRRGIYGAARTGLVPDEDLENVQVCKTCHELFEDEPSGGRPVQQRCACLGFRGNPDPEDPWQYEKNQWVRTCACCGLAAIRAGSPHDARYCPACAPFVHGLSELLGEVLLPLTLHSASIGALIPGHEALAMPAEEMARRVRETADVLEEAEAFVETARDDRLGLCLDRVDPGYQDDREQVGFLELREAVAEHAPHLLARTHDDHGLFAMALLERRLDPERNPDIAERLRVAAADHVAALPAAEIQEALDQGSSAVGSLCFQWAFANAFAAALPHAGEVSKEPPSLRFAHARLTRRLADEAIARVGVVWGPARVVEAPECPEGLEAYAASEMACDHRQRPKSAEYVMSEEGGGCGMGWSNAYYVATSQGRRDWTLWVQSDDDWGDGRIYSQVASCPRRGVAKDVAAYLLIETWWVQCRDCWQRERPNYSAGGDLVTQDLLKAVADRVWAFEARADEFSEAMVQHVLSQHPGMDPDAIRAEMRAHGG